MALLAWSKGILCVGVCEEVYVHNIFEAQRAEAETSKESDADEEFVTVLKIPEEKADADLCKDEGEEDVIDNCAPSTSAGMQQLCMTAHWSEGMKESFIAVANNRKAVTVWRRKDNNQCLKWRQDYIGHLEKQATSMAFVCDKTQPPRLLVANRQGGVTEHLLGPCNGKTDEGCLNNGRLILGHTSLLLSLAVSRCLKYVATSDIEEKIRISNYPNAYNIQSYCLGHTDYVRTVSFMDLPERDGSELLVSISGDKTIRFWNHLTGACLKIVELRDLSTNYGITGIDELIVRKMVTHGSSGTLAVCYESCSVIDIIRVYRQDTGDDPICVTSHQALDLGTDCGKLWDLCLVPAEEEECLYLVIITDTGVNAFVAKTDGEVMFCPLSNQQDSSTMLKSTIQRINRTTAFLKGLRAARDDLPILSNPEITKRKTSYDSSISGKKRRKEDGV